MIGLKIYDGIKTQVRGMSAAVSPEMFEADMSQKLVDIWLSAYPFPQGSVVETRPGRFFFLFDMAPGRLLAAWGISQGAIHEKRDASRMKGHPNSMGRLYHRGHAIPHQLGGPTDINLVPQLGQLNVGLFRELERKAVDTPGSLYFSYWIYADATSQVPERVHQGLLTRGQEPELRNFKN